MGMSSHVTGFKLPDEKWKKMKAIYDACKVANISPPQEVNEFFDYSPPDDAGVQVGIPCTKSSDSDSCSDIFEVNLKDVPKDVTLIRFVNSY